MTAKLRRYHFLSILLVVLFISGFTPQPDVPDANPEYQTDPPDPPTIEWLTFVGTDLWDFSFSAANDTEGNIFILTNSNRSDDGSISPASDNNQISITKVTTSGITDWAITLETEPHSWSADLALDTNGNIYVTGISNGTWGNPKNPFSEGVGQNMFIAKYNKEGSLLWNTFIGSNVYAFTDMITIDTNENLYVGWSQRIDNNSNSLFLAKLNVNGELQWSKMYVPLNQYPNGYQPGASDIQINEQGDVYVLNNTTVSWGKPIRELSGNLDSVLAKFDSNGDLIWNTFLGGSADDYPSKFEISDDGSIYVVGSSNGDWGAPLNHLHGNYDGFVAKVDSNGTLLWNTFLGGETDDIASAIGKDAGANLYVVGHSNSPWGNPLNEVSANGGTFIARLDSNGALVWNTFLGGANVLFPDSVRINSNVLYITGTSNGNFGNPINPPPGGGDDMFVAAIRLAEETLLFRDLGPLIPELTRHIPTPLDVSTEPDVIGANILLAVFLMLPFAIAVDYFSKMISENEESLTKRIPPIAWISDLQSRSRERLGGSAKQNQTIKDAISLLGVAIFYGLVFSLLDNTWQPLSGPGLVLFLSMTLAFGVIGILDDILQWRAARKWGIPGEYNVRATNIFLSAVSVGISRVLALLPGLMFGSPEAVKIDERLLDKRQNQTLIRISINTYLLITFGAWLPTILTTLLQDGQISQTVKDLVGGLEAFLLVIFAVGLENMFIQLLGFSDGWGKRLKRSNQWTWLVSLAMCTFLFLHTLLNPRNNIVETLQQGNTAVFIGIAIAFIIITLILRFISWRRERKALRANVQQS